MAKSLKKIALVPFKGQFSRRVEEFKGKVFSKRSMVIPGQEITPAEMLNKLKMGIEPKELFMRDSIHEFLMMDNLEKLDYVDRMRQQNINRIKQVNAEIAQKKMEHELAKRVQQQQQQQQPDVT